MQSNLLTIEQAVVAVQRSLNRLLLGPLEFADSAYTSACEQYVEQVRHSVQYTLLMSGTVRFTKLYEFTVIIARRALAVATSSST